MARSDNVVESTIIAPFVKVVVAVRISSCVARCPRLRPGRSGAYENSRNGLSTWGRGECHQPDVTC
jgi:hypothetical protein